MKCIVLLAAVPVATDTISGKSYLPTGYVYLGGGYYDVAENVILDEKSVKTFGDNRYLDLPQVDRDAVLNAQIVNPLKPTEDKFVKVKDVQPTDTVKKTNLIPHRWFGE